MAIATDPSRHDTLVDPAQNAIDMLPDTSSATMMRLPVLGMFPNDLMNVFDKAVTM
jgi:hypothetical protein